MRQLWRRKSENIAAYLFLLPFLIIYSMFMLYPIIRGFVTSLNKVSISMDYTFVGLANYAEMFRDRYFWEALWNTFYFVLISTPTLIVVGLGLALIVNAKLKGTTLLRSVFFLPFVLSISVISSIWVFILQPYTGLLNTFLHKLGVVQELFWLDQPQLAWISVLIATVWWTVGFNMVLFLAGLQEIPEDIYEAARIDGADAWRQFTAITLPSIKSVMLLTVVLQTISSFKLFGQTYLMTKGGPGTSTRTLVQYIYEKGFIERDMGFASAMSYVLFVVTIAFAIIQFKLLSNKD
ncbi:carbohydrate ABC transporter permease [Paenibacillus allorhizosphaerae]|uniref:Lactose transport system permease protein LacF n=1 Tax=Paenibacillus allorhizosphaerae TaxID=2849866 RepID=A0ABM8VSV5_9BACL|nr:sugar ABC transporter permease [Paenibacillus allorhizosphaerae]CAG7657017.1 Lactose transport system permease protein LacF [Paenibacillus allorhizosphaerae]